MQWRYDDNTGRLTVDWVNTDGTIVGPVQHFICKINSFSHYSSYLLNLHQMTEASWDRPGAVTSLRQDSEGRPGRL
jgi:hypothetical protein